MTAIAVPDLRLSNLSDQEQATASRLLAKLETHQPKNLLLEAYYDAKQRVRDLGIAIPPHLRNLEAAIGWPGTAVDALEERLDHDGWSDPDDLGVDGIVEANDLHTELAQGRLDALIYGVSFGVVGAGGPGEPSPLITVESPKRMTASWSRRRRHIVEALLISTDSYGQVDGATLWYDDQVLELGHSDGTWSVRDRSENGLLGRPPVHRMVNRPRSSDPDGRSEITRAVRAYTDHAVRTVVAMEVSRDFHAAPKFWLLGADEGSFVGSDGKPRSAWETYIGRLNAINRDEDGNLPEIKSFSGASPQPFLEQLRGLAQMVSAETSLPIAYLGLAHDANPASADAALVAEARLNKKAERRQTSFGSREAALMRDAVWILWGREPETTPRPIYRPAATPTLSAAADATMKLVSSGILPADSDLTLRRVGLTEDDRAQVLADRRRARSAQTISVLAAAADQARTDLQVADLSDAR